MEGSSGNRLVGGVRQPHAAAAARGPLPMVILGLVVMMFGFFAAHAVASGGWPPGRGGTAERRRPR
jgi:hypothetical protein